MKIYSKQQSDTIMMPFDLATLNIFCSYIMSQNQYIKKSNLVNMKYVFDKINKDSFKGDQDKIKRVEFINRGLEARIVHGYKLPHMILSYINGGVLAESLLDINNFQEISGPELNWIHLTISACMKLTCTNSYIDELFELQENYRRSDYIGKANLVPAIESLIFEMQQRFRRTKVDNSDNDIFTLKDGVYEDYITNLHETMSNPSSKLVTGMAGFNEMLNGGFQGGRGYILFGLPGEGKSLTMLDLAYQIKMNNKLYKPKDPTKIPCIIFLTMENSRDETVTRLIALSGKSGELIDYSPEELIKYSRLEAGLVIEETNPIDIVIKYVPGNSVDTDYLYTLYEELEDMGYEPICLIQDYIKRIRPVGLNSNSDTRIELGRVVDDFKNFAICKNIPVITASQMNRDATKYIDEGRKASKADLVRLLGRSNIGESMLILENIDAAFIIAPEIEVSSDIKYLGIQLIKRRYRANSNRSNIYQPYHTNSIKLIEDVNSLKYVFKESLRSDMPQQPMYQSMTNNFQLNSIREIDTGIVLHATDDDDNVFKPSVLIKKGV